MSESTTMSAMHTKDGALQSTPNTAAFPSAFVTPPKMHAARVRKQVVCHWTAQRDVQLIWNVSRIRRFNIV
ncbi:MAG: hypothetical protein J0I57_01050 [Hyphomicrobium sp.]|jgi:hypothetical protein|nr:hypothetical protein [Hyphomicrobium sp.]MBN9276209.1 hypothetical protein [Hyphomicrobium sp.]ODT30769.1 MAG: hypothetical protein ABS54_01600 [Hyphomicrobium sp. SCN 65-11]